MKRWKQLPMMILIFVLAVSVLFLGQTKNVHAAELNFSVTSEIPDNQRDKKQSYFDLRMKPGQEQTVYVVLKNTTKEAVTVNISANEAKTNSNGTAQYDKNNIKRDTTLEYSLEDIVTVENTVKVKPNKEVKVPIKIKMPKEEVNGIILGGLSFQQKESEVEKQDKNNNQNKGMSIKNRFSYNLAMVLSTSDNKVKPELVLNDVQAETINARTVITANVQNTQPILMNQLEINSFVTKKGNTERLYKKNAKAMQMAPNSNFNFQIPLLGETIEAGTYTVNMTAKSLGETWEWKKDFEVTSDEAAKLNKLDVDRTETGTNWWLWIGVAVAAIVVIAIIIVLIRKNSNNKSRRRRR